MLCAGVYKFSIFNADVSVFPVRFLNEVITEYSYTCFHETVVETALGFLPSSIAQCVKNGRGVK